MGPRSQSASAIPAALARLIVPAKTSHSARFGRIDRSKSELTYFGVVGPTRARLPTSLARSAELGMVRCSVRYLRQRGILLAVGPRYREDRGQQ
jgi:hypothetical protein